MAGRPATSSVPAGLRLRTGLLETDFAALAEIRTRANAADGVEEVRTVEGITNEVRHRTGWDPAEDVFLAEVNGHLVGWSVARVAQAGTKEHVFSVGGTVDPAYRRRGVGRALLRRGEARLRERERAIVGGGDAGAGDARQLLLVWHPDTDPGARRLFESEGYRPIRFFFQMVRPDIEGLDPPVVPDGFEVRPFRDADLDAIFTAEEDAFAEEWLEERPTPEQRARYLGRPDVDPALWQVAWHGDEVAGIVFPAYDADANARYGRRRVLLDAVAVRRPFRRRGLATALMLRALHAARERGFTSADLSVDAQNPSGALAIYERLGFQIALRSTGYSKPFDG